MPFKVLNCLRVFTVLLAIFIAASSHANDSEDRFYFEGTPERTYLKGVLLSPQLAPPRSTQTYGSCHVEAAVTAFQSACFRKTGKYFDVSVGYLFYRHVRASMYAAYKDWFLSEEDPQAFSENDGGFPTTTLDRIISGSVVLQSEFVMRDFTRSARSALRVRRSFWRLAEADREREQDAYEQRLIATLAKDSDEAVRTKLKGRLTEGPQGFDHFLADNPAHPLNECEPRQLKYLEVDLTPEIAVRLITAGIPILCTHHFNPDNEADGDHVYLLGGYSYKEPRRKGLAGTVEYFTRDSNSMRTLRSTRRLGCINSHVLFNSFEEKMVLEAIRQ